MQVENKTTEIVSSASQLTAVDTKLNTIIRHFYSVGAIGMGMMSQLEVELPPEWSDKPRHLY